MTGILSRIFGGKKTEAASVNSDPTKSISATLAELLQVAGLSLDFKVQAKSEGEFEVDIFGDDEELLLSKEGQLLDGIQLFLTRVCQHRFPDLRVNISVDNSGYREEVNRELIDLAEKLKTIAMEKGKPVYFRALPPRDRKLVHQYLAEDGRVRSRSVGEGLFKKIKIFPTNSQEQTTSDMPAEM